MKIQLDLTNNESGVPITGTLTFKVSPNKEYAELDIDGLQWFVKISDLKNAIFALN